MLVKFVRLGPLHCRYDQLIAHPVGDGNAIEFNGSACGMMDCGGDARAGDALMSASKRGMSEFLLTHLHDDHYDGVTRSNAKLHTDVRHIYFAALPLIASHSLTLKFAQALFTVNAILGNNSGVPEQDLIDAFCNRNPNRVKPTHSFLAKGDLFDLGGIPFEVLWPPPSVDGLVAKAAKDAVEELEKAIQNDPDATKIHKRLAEEARAVANRARDKAKGRNIETLPSDDDRTAANEEHSDEQSPEISLASVPPALAEANRKIRQVANRLSLAMRSGPRLLHLGDLEAGELNKVVRHLGTATSFDVIVAAHHGTHWGSQMATLACQDLLVSNGSKMKGFWKPGYDQICNVKQETHVVGYCFLNF